MSVTPMKRIDICALRGERKQILENLQGIGAIQIECSELEGNDHFFRQDTQGSIQQFRKMSEKLDQAADTLQKFSPVRSPLFAEKDDIGVNEFLACVDRWQTVSAKADAILKLRSAYDDARSAAGDARAQIESLQPWLPLDMPLNVKKTGRTDIMTGSLPFHADREHILSRFESSLEDEEQIPIHLEVISSEKNMTAVCAVVLREHRAAAERALRSMGFTDPQVRSDTTARDACGLFEEKALKEDAKAEAAAEKIKALSDDRYDLRVLSDYFRIRSQKYEVIAQLPQTENVFLLSGYIPASKAERVAAYLNDSFTCCAEVRALSPDEEAPVLLKNNYLASSVEGVVESYGLPSKKDVDPSAIMFWFYVAFFGLMLSDAAYGLIMTFGCAGILLLKKKMAPTLRRSFRMFMYCGISTTVWGFLFGSFFGDVISVVSTTFLGHPVTLPALWFVPLDDPMRMLMYSMLFGIIHLFFALGIKGYMLLRERQFIAFLSDVLAWYLLVTGLIMVLISSSFFESIGNFRLDLGPVGVKAMWGVALAGALILLLFAGRESKNPVLRLVLGLYEIYGITSWLSDILSYSRLLALGLATGVIAQVVNQSGAMLGNSVPGVIMFILVFIIGHALNFAINALGAYVHTNRLQYVEFFGKFYESGGQPFRPFFSDTKYVNIQSKEV